MRQKKAFTICMALLPAAIFFAAAAALCMGQFRISPGQILAELSGAGGNPANVRTVLFNIRIPYKNMAFPHVEQMFKIIRGNYMIAFECDALEAIPHFGKIMTQSTSNSLFHRNFFHKTIP